MTHAKFVRLSGVESNVAEMRRVIAGATNRTRTSGQKTILSTIDRRDDLQPVFLRQQPTRVAVTGFSTRTAQRRRTRTIDRSRAGRQRARTRQLQC